MVSLASQPPFRGLTNEMSKMMDQLQRGYYGFSPGETWRPPVNLYESDQAYLVCVDLAGVDKEKIEIELVEHQLTIRGTREVPSFDPPEEVAQSGGARKLRVHLMEIDHGSFARQVEVPVNVSKERIQATYRSGMLWIELPKK